MIREALWHAVLGLCGWRQSSYATANLAVRMRGAAVHGADVPVVIGAWRSKFLNSGDFLVFISDFQDGTRCSEDD